MPPAPTPDPHTMRCMEVWGGNQAVDNGVVMAGLDAWLYSRPFENQSAGGDLHYVSSCAAGMVTRVLVADVSGHGEAVAETARSLRGLMRRYVNYIDQTRFVQGLNVEFGELSQAGGFATAVVATYFAETDEFTLCNAGHPRPLWYKARSRSWSLMAEAPDASARRGRDSADPDGAPANAPLGIAQPTCYDQVVARLAVGDLVVLYTDSLIEAKSPEGRLLGQDGLLRLIQGLDPSDPSDLVRSILDAAGSYAGGELAGDDVTILILRPNGLKPRVSIATNLKAMTRLAGAFIAALRPGGPPFPAPESGPFAALGPLLNRDDRPRRV